jgi:hypothetical protein
MTVPTAVVRELFDERGEERADGLALISDGREFLELVREYELAFAGWGGQYDPIPAAAALPPSRHLFGAADHYYSDEDGHPYLLEHGCGDPGCWPFVARISLDGDTVVWSEFRQPHRLDWSYEGFGPFVFDRAQYEAALEEAARAVDHDV